MINKKLNRKSLVIISICIFIIIIATVFYIFFPFKCQIGKVSDEVWADTNTFSLDYTVQLEKDPEKDFIVLNLADVQLTNLSLFNGTFRKATSLITKLIEDKDPDLITLTGDNFAGARNYMAIKAFSNFIDKFNIPWAPVMGNHDDDGSGDFNFMADILLTSKNCILKKGPSDLGVGNYVISIMENNEIVEAIIMVDGNTFEDSEHETLWSSQQNWYTWVVSGLNSVAGHRVDSTVMFHIPLVEYSNAWDYWVDSGYDSAIGSGVKNEVVCSSDTNSGFFNLMKELGSTKNVVCGHDHVNTYSILYEGIRLTYGVKSSTGSYYDKNILGGTILSISSSGVSIEQYIP